MSTLLVTIAGFSIFILLMAVGVIFSNKALKGSCGGLGKIMGAKCLFCKNTECKDKVVKP
ncbi:MAG: (Na+)-NQR maturation NqrM [Halobacteriovoraceae bacterium]|nr:(Na+)-NQR maturation NqrM [Halobacteriovoraceae bacterium]MBT5095692.1 (Na+)-NQR maturation NqrM [Halobacteriovoraceae bacterium]